MTIRRIQTPKGVCFDVDLYASGRGGTRIRRRFKRKIDAQNFIDQYLAEKQNFKKTGRSVALLEEVSYRDEANFWLESMRHHFSVAHLKRVEAILKEQLERFGSYTLDRLDAAFLTQYQRELKSRRQKNATINRKTEVFTAIFNHSVRHRRIPYTPAIGFRKLPLSRDEIVFWERHEVADFLSFMGRHYTPQSPKRWIYVAYLTALNTGLRAGELWGLRPEDIMQGETLFIRRQLNRITKTFDLLKGKRNSKSGRLSRHVPCNPEVKRELMQLIESHEIKNQETIFQNLARNPVDHDRFRKVFARDLKAWGGRALRFHDLRHTAITQMIAAGVDLKTVQAIAGHEDIKTTMNYIHLVGDSIKDVARSFPLSAESDNAPVLTLISS
jgi:integrase